MKDKNKSLKKVWSDYWVNYHGVTKIGAWSQRKALEKVFLILSEQIKSKNLAIVDLGCGEGRTLLEFKKNGYKNIIGIDYTQSSLKICQKKGLVEGKDIFFGDALKTKFDNSEFDLVFSEGLLEHFSNPKPIVKEMARISKKYILLIQPNHYSLYGFAISSLGRYLRNNVKEYSFNKSWFVKEFRKSGFILKDQKQTPLREFFILLFEKI